MRYAILGDIHANLEALDVVIEDAGSRGAERYFSVGDVVGYGADPKACIERLRGLSCLPVMGNHDSAVIGKTDDSYFNPYARSAVLWTQRILSPGEAAFLQGLPIVREEDEFTIVHSTLRDPENWDYILNLNDAYASFSFLRKGVCFVGHSHVPVIFSNQGSVIPFEKAEFSLEDGDKYIVNAGSIGQPRDGIPDACYVIYDSARSVVEYRRIPYDVPRAQEKILSAGLPEILAARLEIGR